MTDITFSRIHQTLARYRIEMLADQVAELGLEGIELPIRPGYQVAA